MNKHFLKGSAALCGLVVLIFDSNTAINGALQGIEQCIKNVIPSLFPFFVLSSLLVSAFAETNIAAFNILADFFGLPIGSGTMLISSFLGGYPVGARTVAEYYKKGIITRNDAEKILPICNNSGPAYIFGVVSHLFGEKWIPLLIWIIQITSSFIISKCISHDIKADERTEIPSYEVASAVSSAIRSIVQVCAWVILFRILISFFDRWFLGLLPRCIRVLIIGSLELTNGCTEVATLNNRNIRFVLSSIILSFGGFCVGMQTEAVAQGLKLNRYYKGKILQAFISGILSITIIYCRWIELAMFIIMTALFQKFCRKGVEFPKEMMYNSEEKSWRKLKCSFVKK